MDRRRRLPEGPRVPHPPGEPDVQCSRTRRSDMGHRRGAAAHPRPARFGRGSPVAPDHQVISVPYPASPSVSFPGLVQGLLAEFRPQRGADSALGPRGAMPRRALPHLGREAGPDEPSPVAVAMDLSQDYGQPTIA